MSTPMPFRLYPSIEKPIMQTSTTYNFLVPEAGSAWQEFVVKDTGIRASTLALAVRNEGRSTKQVAADYHVPLEAVLEAVDYVSTHLDELERERQEVDQELIRRGFMNPDGTWKSTLTTT